MTNLDREIKRARARRNSRYARLRKQFNRGLINNGELLRLTDELNTRRDDESEAAIAADETERGTTTSAKAQVN